MSHKAGRQFSTGTSSHRKRQMSTLVEKEGNFGPALTVSGSRLTPRVCSFVGLLSQGSIAK